VRTTRFAWLRPRRRCPPGWKLTRAASSEPRDPEIEAHVAACAACAAEFAALREIAAEARSLPAPPRMNSESRAAISARLLAAPPEPRRREVRPAHRTAVFSTLAAAVALAIVGVAVSDRRVVPAPPAGPVRPPAFTSRASIRAIGNARFFRAQPPPDEIVRLDDGRIELDVNPLAAGERFRVVTDSGEIEVRGTRFEVLASHGTLRSVSVSRGRVEVRSGGGLAVLDPGDRWEQAPPPDAAPPAVVAPATRAAVIAPAPAVAPPPPARRGPAPSAPSRGQASANESALFDRAWSSLRAGNAGEAAASFAELERRARGHAIEEDALYWRAVSVARTKDSAAAGLLFREFLRRFSGSSRRGEASLALGWILLDAGNVSGAKQAFEQALSDPAGSVRDSAREGLRRTPPAP
jgi:hypothetical protein